MGLGLVVFKCVVCGAAFTKRQSLAAHMRVHRDVEWASLHVRLPRAKVERFKRFCEKHNTTTCHVISVLLDAVDEGDKRGVIKLSGPNPFIITVQEFYSARPKAPGKYAFPVGFEPARLPSVPRCGQVQSVSLGAGEIYCSGAGTWVSPEKCGKCGFNRGFIKLG